MVYYYYLWRDLRPLPAVRFFTQSYLQEVIMEELKEVFPGIEIECNADAHAESCDDECVGGTASTANMKATM
jgi:hypothetical protein